MAKNVIETRGLTVFYGKHRGIEEVDLQEEEGEVFGFLGPNGAGKTTTQRVLLDIIRPSAGEARIFGLDCQKEGVAIRKRVGYLPGELSLYSNMNARDFFEMFSALQEHKGGSTYWRSLAERLELDTSRTIREFSRGNKQKVGLVTAFMTRPQELYMRRNAILGWGIGLTLFPLVYVTAYPSFADQMGAFQEIMDLPIYQALGISMGSFESYIASTVINMVPLIITIFAIMNGTGTLAGKEDDGRLELIVALPIPRWQIVTVKAVATGVALFLILALVSAASAVSLAMIANQVETTITPVDFFFSLLAAWPLLMAIAMISLFLGAFTPNRRAASLLATLVVVVSYFGSNLAGMLTSLADVQRLFLFYYFDASAGALIDGQPIGNILTLLTVLLVAFGLALFFFQRRDITVGVWPWQRVRLRSTA
jgi:ABC-type transport system involved in cytochrome c biogenesis ATPase subunit/ABC-type transport system involved in multi-copper enzyme maturation permease subunit